MRVASLRSIPLALLGALALLLSLASVASAAEETFTATLEGGAAETPPGDPDGSGSATIVIDVEAGTLCWEITVENIMPATASHIHEAPPGEAGPVVVPLDADGFEGSSEGCIEPMEDAAQLQEIVDDPAAYYVNVHTSDYQGGAVRGQLAAAETPNTALRPSPASPLVLLGVAFLLAAVLGTARVVVRAR